MFSGTNTQRTASLGITREHGGVADVGESEEEHHHTLQTDSAARMRVGSVREGLEVAVQRLEGDAAGLGSLREELGVVDSLGAGDDLLAANEDIVGVGELLAMRREGRGDGVLRVGHRVEGADGERELVQDVEVGVVLLLHQAAELLLHGRAEIAHRIHVEAVVDQQLHALGVGQNERLLGVDEGREGVLRLRERRARKPTCTALSSFAKRALRPSKMYTNMLAIMFTAS